MGLGYIPKKDESGRPYSNSVISMEGAVYLSLGVDVVPFQASDAIRCKDFVGDDYLTNVKYYDAEYGGTELVSPSQLTLDTQAKRMEFTVDIDTDFELVQGAIVTSIFCPYDLYFSVANGLASLGDAYCKSFVENVNLKYVREYISNGRSPKMLKQYIDAVPGVKANIFKFKLIRKAPVLLINNFYQMNISIDFYRM